MSAVVAGTKPSVGRLRRWCPTLFSMCPRELETAPPVQRRAARDLLRRRDFRRLYLAVAASELGDSLYYIALMWFAFDAGGPLGVVAVRVADSVPALVFGLHGGVAADRWSRRRLMIGADVVRTAVLVPIAIAGLAGSLPLWGLVVASFVLEAATSYFAPAYGATLPTLVDRENVQQANAFVEATTQALSIGGWAVGGAAPHRPSVERVLRRQRGVVRRVGAADRTHPPRVRARSARSARRGSPRGWRRCGRGPRWPPASWRSASRSRSPRGRGSAASRRSSGTRCTTAPEASRS